MKSQKRRIIIGLSIFISFCLLVLLFLFLLKKYAPHNSNKSYEIVYTRINEIEKKLTQIDAEVAQISIKQTDLEYKYGKLEESIVSKYKITSINRSEITKFSDLKSQFDFYKRSIDKQYNKIQNLTYTLEEFSKNYPEGKLYASRIAELEDKMKMEFSNITTNDNNLKDSIEGRLDLWGKSFDLYGAILSIMATALVGLIGFIIYTLKKD
jgi:DNA repair exonuclease SbcCD ATPase subunit